MVFKVKMSVLSHEIPFVPYSWIGYEHSSFIGQQFILEKGDYPRIEAYSGSNSYRIERMISFRPICSAVGSKHKPPFTSPHPRAKQHLTGFLLLTQNHKEARMTIFELENMTGRKFELSDDYPSLQAMGWINNEVGSLQIQSGAYVSYRHTAEKGGSAPRSCGNFV